MPSRSAESRELRRGPGRPPKGEDNRIKKNINMDPAIAEMVESAVTQFDTFSDKVDFLLRRGLRSIGVKASLPH